MAAQAGFPMPAYHFEGKGSRAERERYLFAVQQGYLERYEPLEDFFEQALLLGEAQAALR
jgi:hypothetical protein